MAIDKIIFNPIVPVGFQKVFDIGSLNGVYEPIISAKNTAFNKNFGNLEGTVSEGNHTHNGVYEPIISAKNTAFNKDFGNLEGTVSEGNHTHYEIENEKNYSVVYPLGTNDTQNRMIKSNTPISISFDADKDSYFDILLCFDNNAISYEYLKIYENDLLIYSSTELNIQNFKLSFSTYQGIFLNKPIQLITGKTYKIEVEINNNNINIAQVLGNFYVDGVPYSQAPNTSITYFDSLSQEQTVQGYSLLLALIYGQIAQISTQNGEINIQGTNLRFNGQTVYTFENLDLSKYAQNDLSNVQSQDFQNKVEAVFGLRFTGTIEFKDNLSNIHTIEIENGFVKTYLKTTP